MSNFLPRSCLTCPLACQVTPMASITCSLRYPILPFFVDTKCDPVWCNLPPSARQTTPCVASTVASRCCSYTTNEIQKTSYVNGLRWALKLWKIQMYAAQPKHWSLIIAHVARTAQPLVAVLFVLVPPKETFANRIGYLSQAACS